MRVTTVDGRVLEAELRYQRGGATNPMSVAEVIAKYRINAGLALPATATTALESAVLSLEAQINLDDLAVLAAARSGEVVSIPSAAPISEGTL